MLSFYNGGQLTILSLSAGSGVSENILQNVALGKSTSLLKASSAPHNANFHRWGDKSKLVDGSLSASLIFDGGGALNGCSGCFASNAIEGYWEVNLGDKHFVPYVRIVRVAGEIIDTQKKRSLAEKYAGTLFC